jgi:hypothetical protein
MTSISNVSHQHLGAIMLKSNLVLLFLILVTVVGCGGGGGGGGGSSGGGPTIVYVGTTAFNPATSRGLADHDFGFPVPATWTFDLAAPADPVQASGTSQTLALSSVVISGVTVPCYRVSVLDGIDPEYDQHEWWAVSTDGGLYRLTVGAYDHEPGPSPVPSGYVNNDADSPTLLAQAKLIMPGSFSVGTSWTVGASAFLYPNVDPRGHLLTRTVMSTNATSPHGFPGCVLIKGTLSGAGSEWFEYWQPDVGLVEVEEQVTSPAPDVYYISRTDVSTSG